MINKILHSPSFNIKFIKLVVDRNYTTRFINFIINGGECKILLIT